MFNGLVFISIICVSDLNQVSSNAWREKDINQWECIDTLNWIIEETSNYGINYEKISMKGLSVTGHVLISMSESDFVRCDPEVGSLLYHSFQRLRYARETHFSYSMSNAYCKYKSLVVKMDRYLTAL